MIILSGAEPFARGGNRLCFVDPECPNRCIKVRRPSFSLADLRRKKGFPYTCLPVSWVDESVEENKIHGSCERRLGVQFHSVVSRNYGFVETDMGPGLCSELIRNDDGKIALSVMEYLWNNGKTASLMSAVDHFSIVWPQLKVPSRDLLLHNVVAPCGPDGSVQRLVVVDGLGYSGGVPFSLQPSFYKVNRGKRKVAKFRQLIDTVLLQRDKGETGNMFWKQKHDGLDGQGREST